MTVTVGGPHAEPSPVSHLIWSWRDPFLIPALLMPYFTKDGLHGIYPHNSRANA